MRDYLSASGHQYLIFCRQLADEPNNGRDRRGVICDESVVVHRNSDRHQKLAIHAIHEASVSGNDRVEVFNRVGLQKMDIGSFVQQ